MDAFTLTFLLTAIVVLLAAILVILATGDIKRSRKG